MNEAEFKKLNDRRLQALRTLANETLRDGELFDAMRASGHIGDYRAWENQRRRAAKADEHDQRVRQAMVAAGLLR